jgi:hypothetical protein
MLDPRPVAVDGIGTAVVVVVVLILILIFMRTVAVVAIVRAISPVPIIGIHRLVRFDVEKRTTMRAIPVAPISEVLGDIAILTLDMDAIITVAPTLIAVAVMRPTEP